jgi:hypothetical protein
MKTRTLTDGIMKKDKDWIRVNKIEQKMIDDEVEKLINN